MEFRFYASRSINTHALLIFLSLKIAGPGLSWTFLKKKFQETEISCREKEMSQNFLWEENVSLEYGDEC